ncbi:YlaI family protein [Ectobacillus polymachus]|uniref:YlaI family protein n=1 Tax=Ectobacillus polymachus TaxID=1508806 RepID=UPI003A8693B3
MRVKCVLCDGIHKLDDDTLEAKRLRNRPIHTYMCPSCYSRISERTNSRIASGKFRLYRDKSVEEEW